MGKRATNSWNSSLPHLRPMLPVHLFTALPSGPWDLAAARWDFGHDRPVLNGEEYM